MKQVQSKRAYSTLQKELMHSLKILITPDKKLAQDINDIDRALQNVVIPNDDYKDVLHLIILLLHFHPDIMGNPNDYALKKLCLRCLTKM